ncbi:MAG: hypothetical protein ACKVOQ_21280 [Cyclobacteriaceae bacterium]
MLTTKKHTALFLLSTLLTLPILSFSQKSEKQLGLGTGWYHHSFSDPTIATSSNIGSSVPILLFFRSNGEKNRHHVQLLYATPTLKSTYLSSREQTGYLQYAYHRKIGSFKVVDFFGGGLIEFSGFSRKYSEIGNRYSFLNPYQEAGVIGSLYPSLLVELPTAKNKFSIQSWITSFGSISPLSRLSAIEYLGLNDFFKIESRASYCKYFSIRWEGRVDYQFQYYALSKDQKFSSSTHQLNFSMIYRFR